MQKEYKRLSRRTTSLLKHAEGMDVDFKRDVVGVKAKTLIAFANSRQGGAILVGVEEYTNDDGLQRGKIVGCDVSDSARLQIQNKALGCIPPVNVQIFTENIDANPILRIEIPSGTQKPYGSMSGEYSIRAEGRNRAMQPDELLQVFMERESEQFLQRFKRAVSKLESQVTEMDDELRQGVDQMMGDITRLDRDTSYILNELYGRSIDIREETEFSRRHDRQMERKLSKLKRGLDRKYKELAARISMTNTKLDALLMHFQIEDPIRELARQQIIDMARMIQERENPDMLADFMDVLVHIYPDIEAEALMEWAKEGMQMAPLPDDTDVVPPPDRRGTH